MKIFFIGDVVGSSGRAVVLKHVPEMKASGEVDVVIVNAENAAGGGGITERIALDLFKAGCDVITLGDHAWDKREAYPYLNEEPRVIRPANFAKEAPGHGSVIIDVPGGVKLGVISLVGRTFVRATSNCPFHELDDILKGMRSVTPNIVVDMHAETTSEKVAMGWYADGRVTAVLGTHTHIQTADERVLPQGTAFICDVGMSGPYDSVIGQKKEIILERYLTGMPNKFEVAEGPATMCGVIVDVDEATGKARAIERVQRS